MRRLGTARDKRVTHGNPGYGVGIHISSGLDIDWGVEIKEMVSKSKQKTICIVSVKLLSSKHLFLAIPTYKHYAYLKTPKFFIYLFMGKSYCSHKFLPSV